MSAALVTVASGASLYAAAARWPHDPFWRNAGALCFVAFPVMSACALSLAARKRHRPGGSVVGAVLASAVAVVAVAAWATLNLKGVSAHWTPIEILVSLASVSVVMTASACLGWWCRLSMRRTDSDCRAVSVVVTAAAALLVSGCTSDTTGILRLTIADHDTAETIAARVTLTDSSGAFVIPAEALPVFSDCGHLPFHNWAPAAATVQTYWGRNRSVRNPFRDSEDFYSSGSLATRLPPGRYRIRLEKGPEYRRAEDEFVIVTGQERQVRIALQRWSHLQTRGWYSSDDHLHIPRPSADLDPLIATWMAAEDIHVANLLQMGLARDVHVTPQRAFGPRSVYQSGRTLLVGGQENPRTHVLGHSIILGAKHWIDFPHTYLLYEDAWREARRQGAVAGYAHFAMAGAHDGLALWAREHLIDFIEVLNLGMPYYKTWYEALDLGIRVVPTAGTDYPCVATLPGRERFYVRVDAALTIENWLEALRRGRTFVTNGPLLELSVEGADIGDELVLDSPRTINVTARVRFDPARDRVRQLELVRGGEVIAGRTASTATGDIALRVSLPVTMSTWLAARASGDKVGERPADSIEPLLAYVSRLNRRADRLLREELGRAMAPEHTRPAAAHTAPTYVRVNGTPAIAEQPRARDVTQAWLALLDDLAARLESDRLRDLAGFPGSGDGVTYEDLQANRAALLQAIEKARAAYTRPR